MKKRCGKELNFSKSNLGLVHIMFRRQAHFLFQTIDGNADCQILLGTIETVNRTPTTNISPYLNRQLANWAPQDAEKKHDKLIFLCPAIQTKIQFDTLIK